MALEKYRYVVVEGPIGVGKTSLARRLAEHAQADTLFEKPDENPFLPRFYTDPSRHALPAQLFFLFQRINEVRDLVQVDMFANKCTVSDYLFEKDALFARLNLNNDEYALYQTVYNSLSPQAPTPDLVIYLQAPVESLFERVRRRAIAYETPIAESYLARLAKGYSEFFHHYDAAPVLVVNCGNLNFVDNEEHFQLLLGRIANMRGPREFFSVGLE